MRASGPSPTITPQAADIIRAVAIEHRINRDLIMGGCRWRAVVLARVEIARRLAQRGYSSPKIAAMLHKDHSTVLYYLGNGARGFVSRPTDPPLTDWRKEMKLTHEQRAELVRLAAEGGYSASKGYAQEIGVSPNYGLVLLNRESRKRPPNRKWVRAMAIGPVIA